MKTLTCSFGALALSAGVLLGCSPATNASSLRKEDPSPIACTHWANVKKDLIAEVLTYPQTRDKIGQVRDAATDARVRTAATKLLAAVTTRDNDTLAAAFLELDAACTPR